jgi:hypothetical protein
VLQVYVPWGGIYAFLAGHPALTWQPTAKLVGLLEGIDLDAVPMLPPAAYQQREQQQQQQRGRFEGGPPGSYPPGSGSSRDRGRSRSPHFDRPGSAAAAGGSGRPAAAAAAIPALQISPEDQAGREIYEQVLQFATSLRRQLADNAPEHCMELAAAYELLPLQLRSKVAPGAPIDMQKFLEDNIGGVEVVRRDGRMLVVGLPPGVNRDRAPPRTCAYWEPGSWMGCFKEARCNFRHALGPSDQQLNRWI